MSLRVPQRVHTRAKTRSKLRCFLIFLSLRVNFLPSLISPTLPIIRSEKNLETKVRKNSLWHLLFGVGIVTVGRSFFRDLGYALLAIGSYSCPVTIQAFAFVRSSIGA